MAQALILPINKARLTASIDTAAYYNRFGFRHCGCDLVGVAGSALLYASGNGTVAAIGYDNACGNVVAIVYYACTNHRTGKTADLCLRYFHLASIAVRKGQSVTKDTVIGYYGHTGNYAGTGAHLHLEADTDTTYVLYTPTVTSSNFLRGTRQGAYDYADSRNTTCNPVGWLHCKSTAPDQQTWTTAADVYIRSEDRTIPAIT